jgi:hypothetical protein
MNFNLLGGAYKSRDVSFNSQRCVNFYSVISAFRGLNWTSALSFQTEQNKTQHAKMPTPGLDRFCTNPGQRVRGIYVARSISKGQRCFFVVDDNFYELFRNGSSKLWGTLPGGVGCTQPVYMAIDDNNQLLIIDGGSTLTYNDTYAIVTNNGTLIGTLFNLTTGTLTNVNTFDNPANSYDFPDSASQIGRVYYSQLNDFSTWPTVNVFTPTFRSCASLAVMALREEIAIFGEETVSVYYDAGSTPPASPWVRVPNTTVDCGILAPHSLAKNKDAMFFLGTSAYGEPNVYLFDTGYNMTQITPPSVNWSIGSQVYLKDAIGFLEQSKDGHVLYFLTVPALNTTFVYDGISQEWHERQSQRPFLDQDGSVVWGMFRGRCKANFEGMHLYGDMYSGNILIEDYNTYTEDGLPIRRQLTSPIMSQENDFVSLGSVEIDYNAGHGASSGQGVTPILQIRTSTDGGQSFNPPRYLPLGKQAQYDYRALLTNIGTGRNWVIDIVITDPIFFAIKSAYAHGSVGLSSGPPQQQGQH